MKRLSGKVAASLLGTAAVLGGWSCAGLAEPMPAACAPTGPRWNISFTIYREDGKTLLGTQQAQGETRSGEHWMRSVTEFGDGSRWEEEAAVALGSTLRPLSYTRRFRSGAQEWRTIEIDFKRGRRKESGVEGEKSEPIDLPADTYIGPMVGLVVRCAQANGPINFHSLSFENHPGLHAMGARPLGDGPLPWGPIRGGAASKVLLKADLGTIGNFLLGGVIPANTFWLSAGGERSVLGWEGPSDWKATDVVAVRMPDPAGSRPGGAGRGAVPPP